jgi:cysteine desulfurase
MYVNNEIGTIEPIREIGEMLRKHNKKLYDPIYFHTDATQAIRYLECNVDCLGVDLLSFTGHKIHAPKGIGALYVRRDTPLIRQQDGGGQELGLRAGTENVPYIVGLGKAIELTKKVEKQKIYKLRDRLIEQILQIPDTQLTGAYPNLGRIAHIASFAFKGLRGDEILLVLSKKGIACSAGSACTAGSLEPSHVLKAIGLTDKWAIGGVRFSLSKYTTLEEVNSVVKEMIIIVNKLREENYE